VGTLSPAGPVVTDEHWIRVADSTAAGAVRRAAAAVGAALGLGEQRVAELSIIAAEIASNLHKHADEGHVMLRSLRLDGTGGVEIVAYDSGPGMVDAIRSGHDGHSTTGTLGIGLGAISRLATRTDLYSLPGRGMVVTAQVWPARVRPDPPAEGVTRPMAGESVSGDAWAVRYEDRLQIMVCDGLGHGPLAATAARTSVDAFRKAPAGGPAAVVEHLHRAMGRTRGGAVAVAALDGAAGELRYAGLGNIAGHIVSGGSAARRGLVSLPGIAGHQRRVVREYVYPVGAGDLVVLHSDGVTDKWRLADYPGLAAGHSPLVVATVLLRDAGVRRDDATVVVARVGP
jgi:anti-sigma regulatory factor (Ser/Thr protein kinase)